MVLTTRYKYFWPDFDPKKSLFHCLLQKITGSTVEVVDNPDKIVDLEFQSVYRNASVLGQSVDRLLMMTGRLSTFDYVEKYRHGFSRFDPPKAKQSVWYTAENLRAPHNVFTSTIGFDATDAISQNTFFPFWMYRLNWDLGNELSEICPRPEDLVNKRIVDFTPRHEACVFSSTRDPGRLKLISIVERDYLVHKYGSGFQRRVESKLTAAQGLKFQVCPENSNTWGYVTEKLVESWSCKNLAIWEGVHGEDVFNKDSYLDVTGKSSTEILTLLKSVTDEEWKWRLEQPLLLKLPSLTPLIDHFNRILDRI